jgi:hypothetical protein
VSLKELEVRYNEGPNGCNRYRVLMDPRNICTPAENAPPQKMRGSRKRTAKSAQATPQDPAESAPPQILQEPPQNLHPTPAESAPVTVLEPKANQHQKTSSSGGARERATRIPDDFAVTPEMADWARIKTPRLIGAGRGKDETEQFIDHWRQSSSPNARKLDWPAAWRVWMRRTEKDLAQNGIPGRGPTPGARPSTTDQRVAQAEALKAELRNGAAQP